MHPYAYVRRHKTAFFVLAVPLVALASWYVLTRGADAPVPETAAVVRGDVADVVNVTGHAEPLERLELAFASAGRLARVYPEEGARVRAGAPIAILETSIESARLAEYAARIDREVALLNDLEAGTASETLARAEASYEQQQALYDRSIAALAGALDRAYRTADDMLRDKVDEVFGGVRDDPRFGTSFELGTTKYFIRADGDMTSRLTAGRAEAAEATERLDALRLDGSQDPALRALQAEQELARIQAFLDDVAVVVHGYIPTDSEAQTVYASYQADIAAARSSLQTAQDTLRTAHTDYVRARGTLDVEEWTRAQTEATPRPFAVAAQDAALRAALAARRTQEAVLGEAVLRSPITGIVTKIERRRGEVVAPGTVVAEVFADGAYELVAYIPEADVASVALGDTAQVTFDAFERTDIFRAKVVRIALSETVREGVPTYKTTLVITDMPERGAAIRAGMTADIAIEAELRSDVLFVPSRSVLREGERSYVRVFHDGLIEERDVEPGLRGSEGTTEVVSGLTEGEEVVLFMEDE